MERDLQVMVNAGNHLVVDSPSQPTGTWDIVFYLFLLGGLAYVVYRMWPVSRIAAAGLVAVALVVSLFVWSNQGTSYRMDMDRATDQLTVSSFRGSDRTQPLTTTQTPLDSLTRADMEFDRNYRRITLSTRDGKQVRPLGPDYNIMDSQFNVLGDIQRFLGQEPTTPAGK